VLRACRRLLRRGGRLAFFTIHVAQGLSRAEHRRAAGAAPVSAAGPDIAELLRRARFDDVEETDLSAAYAQTARDWLDARLRHRDALRPLDPATYDDRVARGRGVIPVIEAGLLRRSLFLASKRS
jgi:cyclopropane fatty-acyl-phospholipid synthase-like methyltransferase